MSIWEGLVGYYGVCGLKGVAAICSHRLLGIPERITLHPACVKAPVHLRVRTSDVSLYKSILLGAEYDPPVRLSPETIVDAGANCGMATLFFANKYPKARIIAVEPEPSNYSALLENTYGYPNVVPVKAALWKDDCELKIGTGSHFDKWAFQVSDKGTAVNGVTLPSLMRAAGIQSIDLLKIDIEGAEAELFENPDWLGSVKAMAVEFHEGLRPGCKAKADAVCGDFKSWQRGETTFYVRQ
jgi:FkbM family methyltransferase